jgi:hypothetical protein
MGRSKPYLTPYLGHLVFATEPVEGGVAPTQTSCSIGSFLLGRNKRVATRGEDNPEGRWRSFTREELLSRDKASLDLFWLKDKSLTDLDNLPEPDDLAEEIIEGLEAGLTSLRSVLGELRGSGYAAVAEGPASRRTSCSRAMAVGCLNKKQNMAPLTYCFNKTSQFSPCVFPARHPCDQRHIQRSQAADCGHV